MTRLSGFVLAVIVSCGFAGSAQAQVAAVDPYDPDRLTVETFTETSPLAGLDWSTVSRLSTVAS